MFDLFNPFGKWPRYQDRIKERDAQEANKLRTENNRLRVENERLKTALESKNESTSK